MTPESPQLPAWEGLRDSWVRSLQARNIAPRTVRIYSGAANALIGHLAVHEPQLAPHGLARRHLETFFALYQEGRAAAMVSITYRALQQWMRWLHEEQEISGEPMRHMPRPIVPEKPVPIITADQLTLLFSSATGSTFADRRDNAILRMFLDTGARLSELANLKVTDVALDERTALVLGKGRRARQVSFGAKTGAAVDRYLRSRRSHKDAYLPDLWLGQRGRLQPNGVYQMVQRRAQACGFTLHPHQFRHTASHLWLSAGGSETGLMTNNGWRSRSMVSRYAASAAAQRAREEHARLAVADQW